MTPTLFHAVARRAEALAPDADLLARYVGARDEPSFEELVRRHGPLVWGVCRHLLPCRADAEDAFQAVFLALVRSAAGIRDGRTLPAWLHGAAVRVATQARRAAARRRARERREARPEVDRPVSDAAWGELLAAVHEEVQRLPAAERTAFVLCDLQGVSQPDAAVRLGCPLGSVSGRLCKARRRLLDRLAARGVAPAAVVGIGVGSERFGGRDSELVLVFKKPKGGSGARPGAAGGMGFGTRPGMPGGGGAGRSSGPGNARAPEGNGRLNQVLKLRNAGAADAAERVMSLLTKRGGSDPLAGCVVVAEPVSNSILVSGDADTLKAVVELIELIDGTPVVLPPKDGPPGEWAVQGPMGGPGSIGGPRQAAAPAATRLVVFKLKAAKAEAMVAVLQKLFPDAELAPEPRTNAIIARAGAKALEEIASLIDRLEALEPAK